MQKASKAIIYIILFIGLYGTIGLAKKEYLIGNICPKLLGIPACYIILTCFLLALISHIGYLKDQWKIYWIGILTALSLATYGTLGELFNFAECPKTDGGIPMCFISFAIFSSLALFKIIEWKLSKRKEI